MEDANVSDTAAIAVNPVALETGNANGWDQILGESVTRERQINLDSSSRLALKQEDEIFHDSTGSWG